MSVYSTKLFAGSVGSTLETIYQVPAGEVVVVRDIEAYNSAGTAQKVWVTSSVSGSTVSFIYVSSSLATSTHEQWQGRVVLNAGDTLNAQTNLGPGFYLHVSGYVFQQ